MGSQSSDSKLTKWKETAKALRVRVTVSDGRSREGEAYLQTWDRKTRGQRAIKAWALCWGGAMIAILIPLLHFILVPSLILAGPIVAYLTFQQESRVLGGKSTCPACENNFEIISAKNNWPLKDVCGKCQEHVKIEEIIL